MDDRPVAAFEVCGLVWTMTQYSLTLDLPPSLNRYWRKVRNRIIVSSEAKAYKDVVGWQAKIAGCNPIDGPVGVEVQVYRARKTGDLDNYLKVLLDAMQGFLYGNDKQITTLLAYRHDDAKNPRVEVKVWEASE